MSEGNPKTNYTASEILEQLDKCAKECSFPILDNGYIHLVHSKLSAYRDDERWALVIEVIGFSPRDYGHEGVNNCLYIFGNCISMRLGLDDSSFLYLTHNSAECPTFDEEFEEFLNPVAKTMMIRDKEIKLNHNREFYLNKGIELVEEDKIRVHEVLRGLVPEFNKNLEATEEEIRSRIPTDLPKVLELLEWNHPDCAGSELPSNNETFQQIAKVLETSKLSHYNPSFPANNHWKNWSLGGTL